MDLVKSTSKVFISKTAGSVIIFAGITFFAREIGAFQIGIFFLFQALLGILSVPADLGIRGAIEKRISGTENPNQMFATGVVIKIFPLLITVAAILFFQDSVNEYIGASVAIYLVIGLILQELNLLFIHTLNGELRVGETAIILFIRKFVWFVVGVFLIISGLEAEALIIGLITGHFLALLLGAKRVSVTLARPSRVSASSIYDYAKFDLISSAGSRFYGWLDVAVIGFFLTQEFVGAYEIAWRVSGITIIFVQAIRTSIFPEISKLHKEEKYYQIEEIIYNSITPALFFVIPSFFGLLILSRDVLSLIFGAEYAIAWFVLLIFMAQKMIQSINDIIGRSLQAVDHPDLAAYAMLAGIIVNIVLNILLVIYFGITGAALATLLSNLTMVSMRYVYLSRIITISAPYVEIGWCIVASSGMAVILLGLDRAISIDSVPILLLIVLLGVVTYFALIMLYPPLRKKIYGAVAQLY